MTDFIDDVTSALLQSLEYVFCLLGTVIIFLCMF